jgi:hypothetical protein
LVSLVDWPGRRELDCDGWYVLSDLPGSTACLVRSGSAVSFWQLPLLLLQIYVNKFKDDICNFSKFYNTNLSQLSRAAELAG